MRNLKIGHNDVMYFFCLVLFKECREACGGQGVKTENRVGHLKGDYDGQTTFEGDNNVLMQQVSYGPLSICFDYTMLLIGSFVELR